MTRAAVVTHGTPGQIGSGLARLQAVAQEHDVELLFPQEEGAKHSRWWVLGRAAVAACIVVGVALGVCFALIAIFLYALAGAG